MDDITPTMDWARFYALISLFRRFKVKPLLGVVPDNRDPKLHVSPPAKDFWERLRVLAARDEVEFAQHGYQHIMTNSAGTALIGAVYGLKERSEFAGLSYDEQRAKIRLGQSILRHHGIETTFWMAPNHSFDRNTLKALRDCGFTALTDGISLFPFKDEGIICIPQQLWKPKWMPTGTITICLHSDEITVREVARIRQFLNMRPRLTSFSEEVARYRAPKITEAFVDNSFRTLYVGARRIRGRASPAASTKSKHSEPPKTSPTSSL
jgi:predicted deacetylase